MYTNKEVVCLYCNQRVGVSIMNGEYRRVYHHDRTGRACAGSRGVVISTSVISSHKEIKK